MSFADSDAFTFTDNTVIVELNYTANTGTLVKILSIPSGIDLGVGDGRITVRWTAVDGASSYNVYYGTNATPPTNPAQSNITGTSTTITGLANEQEYYVWVQSVKAGFVSELSSVRTVTTPTVYTVNTADTFKQVVSSIDADIAGSYAINVTGSFAVSPITFASNESKIIVIEGDSANRSISNDGSNALFTIPNGITLVLDNNITLNGNNKVASAVIIEAGGALAMNNGSTITGAKSSGVHMNGGTFTMTGGTISGNSISVISGDLWNFCWGGGVFIRSGTFTMSGGTISDNSAYANISDTAISAYCYGGGVFVFNGAFTMTGGTISGNSTSSSHLDGGGGVYVGGGLYGGGNGSFSMTGGTISGNSTSRSGGGVYIESGTFTMDAGTISKNSTYGSGGGVCVQNGTFIMTGGTINENSAKSSSNDTYGGGVVVGGIFTMIGGMISGNSADYGGGVAVWDASGPSFSKTGGTIDATNSAIAGKVASVYYYPYGKTRNTTADPSVNLDSRVTGSAGGWE